MYCPTCATQNGDGTKFCRSCGTNLSLVPQAITGRLPEAPRGRKNRHDFEHGGPANLGNGITKVFMGLGFVLVSAGAFFFAPAGKLWWFWLLIPAFALLGKGVAEIVTALQAQKLNPAANYPAMPPAVNAATLPPQPGFETLPPPSVTEGTTRHMTPVPERHRDPN
ncbi:MAG: zinc-ribbon domain-containing protein [Blastocatellia bacterium]